MIRRPAYAKINLTLDVVGKRGDGYHLLETVMQAVSLCDWVSAEKADGITVRCTDKAVPTDRRNTCHKAAEVFFGAAGIDGGVNVMIEKHIPSEAGLGGGSSDAAALLMILNELYGKPLDEKRLIGAAAKVGADVPFCVVGGRAVCRGIGEDIAPLSYSTGENVVLIKPDFGISTPEAYRIFDEKKAASQRGTEKFTEAVVRGDVPELTNDLEAALGDPRIEALRRKLIHLGARSARMAGSGSCVYGFFDGEEDAEAAEKALFGELPFVCLCRTI